MHTRIDIAPDIWLDTLHQDDLDDLVAHINDPVVYANTLTIPSPYTRKDAEAYLDRVSEFEHKEGIQSSWIIRHKGKLIGGIGVLYNYGVATHKSEIGYWMSRDYRGTGIMTQVIAKFVDHVFAHTALIRLEAHVFVGNTASARVLEKNHFVLEGIARAMFVKDGTAQDTWQYARVKA